MVTHDPPDIPVGFSPELTREVTSALNEYLLSRDAESNEQLRDLTNRICSEAHALGMPPEKMLIAIKHLFERAPLTDVVHSDSRRVAFDKFLSGCIKAYFDTAPPS